VRGADILIFCAPHQFIRSMCKQLIGKIKPDAFAVSLIKVGRCSSVSCMPDQIVYRLYRSAAAVASTHPGCRRFIIVIMLAIKP
jgi:glycerol-3-phosphate dehydrogenase